MKKLFRAFLFVWFAWFAALCVASTPPAGAPATPATPLAGAEQALLDDLPSAGSPVAAKGCSEVAPLPTAAAVCPSCSGPAACEEEHHGRAHRSGGWLFHRRRHGE